MVIIQHFFSDPVVIIIINQSIFQEAMYKLEGQYMQNQ